MQLNFKHQLEVKNFVDRWTNPAKHSLKEKPETIPFWNDLLKTLLGVQLPSELITYNTSISKKLEFDAYIPKTKVLIEQKGQDKDLDQKYTQSDGQELTPFEQANRYNDSLQHKKKARWIVVSNFTEIRIHDMDKPKNRDIPKLTLHLADLEKEWQNLFFLVDDEETQNFRSTQISIEAGKYIGRLYDALEKQYKDKGKVDYVSLNKLCTRLVFCFYAEDTGLFGSHGGELCSFIKQQKQIGPEQVRSGLIELFKILDTKNEFRDKNDTSLKNNFPYVNGGLFDDRQREDKDRVTYLFDELNTSTPQQKFVVPEFDEKIVDLLIKTSQNFNWADVDPTIFGSVFEGTLNRETRHQGGMHYTSIDNIKKVINPLFLDNLKKEFEKAKNSNNRQELLKLQDKLSKLTFFDPACGSGNFLTQTYIELRRLENEILKITLKGQKINRNFSPIKVNISQFYGIEINDFAVAVAQTALWIAENKMMLETAEIKELADTELEFLPLKTYAHIIESNAIKLDWRELISPNDCSYIIGNPPFIGGMLQSSKQKQDMKTVMTGFTNIGELDYVTAWFKKSTDFIYSNPIGYCKESENPIKDTEVALVATNSIAQGQQATNLWLPLFGRGVVINFAYRTFIWNSETYDLAHVHCVIVGFGKNARKGKTIYTTTYTERGRERISKTKAQNINQYLLDAPTVFINSRKMPICNVPMMHFGSMPRDGGYLSLTEEEKEKWLKDYPVLDNWIRPYLGSDEFINSKFRYCLWLVDAPADILSNPYVKDRVRKVKKFRLSSKAEATRKFANKPHLFCQIAHPDTDYILVPSVSSEKRRYVPIGFIKSCVIASNATQIIPNATLYHFGVLTSSVHMAWMRAVAGRLKSDYRYSKDIVYNNFIWCNPTQEQKEKIEETARNILKIRYKYFDKSLAELYGENLDLVYFDLRDAHIENDKAVIRAYGFKPSMTENEIITQLFELYSKKQRF